MSISEAGLSEREMVDSWKDSKCPDGGMVDTVALGATVARHVGSSPTWGTIKLGYLIIISIFVW